SFSIRLDSCGKGWSAPASVVFLTSPQSLTCWPSLALTKAGTRWLPNLRPMPVRFRAVPQRQKVVDLASRQTNQKQIYHFLYSARHFLGCAGVRFSGFQAPEAYYHSANPTFSLVE